MKGLKILNGNCEGRKRNGFHTILTSIHNSYHAFMKERDRKKKKRKGHEKREKAKEKSER